MMIWPQVCVDIREVGNRGLRSMLDHEAGDTDVSGTVDGQRRSHATSCMKKAEKFLVAVSPRTPCAGRDQEARRPGDCARYSVGPHPRNLAEGLYPTQHVPGCGRALVLRVLPVLDPNPTAEEAVRMVGDVARGRTRRRPTPGSTRQR